jgi:hypothetical protein
LLVKLASVANIFSYKMVDQLSASYNHTSHSSSSFGRLKLGGHPPTKVLYVRYLPDTVSESDFISYCNPFGRVANVLLLKDKKHGFVEFGDKEHAVSCVSHFLKNPLIIRGQQLEFAFSGRSEITYKSSIECNPPNRILLLTVTNIVYPVTVEVISLIFAKYGGLEKTIIFNRGNVVQVLVQLQDLAISNICRNDLDGQNIYAGCNTLKVQFSLMTELDVKSNTDRAFDFTKSRNSGDFTSKKSTWEEQLQPEYPSLHQTRYDAIHQPEATGFSSPCVLKVSGINELETSPDHLAALFAIYGNVLRVKCCGDQATVEMQHQSQCISAQQYLACIKLHGKMMTLEIADRFSLQESEYARSKDFASQPLLYARHKAGKSLKLYPPSISLHISNMPDATTEEELLTLLVTVGGEIRHVRFLDEQRHIAIAVCTSVENAIETLVRSHGLVIGMKSSTPRPIRVGFGHQPMDPVFYQNAPVMVFSQSNMPGQVFIDEFGVTMMIANDGSAVPVISPNSEDPFSDRDDSDEETKLRVVS